MKKLFAMMLALSLVLSLAACGSSAPATEATDASAETSGNETTTAASVAETDLSAMTLDELKPLLKTVNDGKLTMVTSPDFAPYEFYALDANSKPQLAGFDIALGGYIADYLGLELEVIPMDFDGTITELGMGNADIGMAGYSPDPARENAMHFSTVYYTGGQSFICHKDNLSKFATLEDTNKPEYQIGAQLASIQADLAKKNSPDADIIELSKVTDIVAEVISGKLDGAYVETVVAQTYGKNYPDLAIALDVPYEAQGSVVGVNKNNDVLLAAVNLAVQAAIDDGSMAKFVAEANELSTGEKYEGLLENGVVPGSK